MRPYNIALSAVESFYSVETGDWPGMIELFEERLEQVQVYKGRRKARALRELERFRILLEIGTLE